MPINWQGIKDAYLSSLTGGAPPQMERPNLIVQWLLKEELGKPVFIEPFGIKKQDQCRYLSKDEVGAFTFEVNDKAAFLNMWHELPNKLGNLPGLGESNVACLLREADITAALLLAGSKPTLLTYQIGPVQPFIAAAKSIRDLWVGSMLLSWLSFEAMKPILDKFGPTPFISPVLRNTPFLNNWMNGSAEEEVTPCIPHRFIALLPEDAANELKDTCAAAVHAAWRNLAGEVRDLLQEKWGQDWDRLWDDQINSFFSISTATSNLPTGDLSELCRLIGITNEDLLSDGLQAWSGFANGKKTDLSAWVLANEFAARTLQAKRSVRHIPNYKATGEVPAKCSLFGSYEQMGPSLLSESRKFWDDKSKIGLDGIHIRQGERLCAIALVKRFAPLIWQKQGLLKKKIKFEDTATVAADEWLTDNAMVTHEWDGWSGQWLHWAKRDQDKDEKPVSERLWEKICTARKVQKPPAYYAILVMDGDHMGRWLQGKQSPAAKEIIPENLFAKLPSEMLSQPLPTDPMHNLAISEAIGNFALRLVPGKIGTKGMLVYAGGDDVLALLPVSQAITVAKELRQAFQSDEAMGPNASISAGIAVVHYKEDLRFALDQARKAESQAKNAGRDALVLRICKRSGDHTSVFCPWEMTEAVNEWVKSFRAGASDRWAYHLKQEAEVIGGLGDVVKLEITRRLKRADEATKEKFNAAGFPKSFDSFISGFNDRPEKECKQFKSLAGFLNLVLAASFLARGRDQ